MRMPELLLRMEVRAAADQAAAVHNAAAVMEQLQTSAGLSQEEVSMNMPCCFCSIYLLLRLKAFA